ncbi:MAG: hypothetical protein Q7S22_08715 [Candidatus Micrarchaeota archaeon]|nr:hypothetical protein [Candidatus Micrarchaeota archaeon]
MTLGTHAELLTGGKQGTRQNVPRVSQLRLNIIQEGLTRNDPRAIRTTLTILGKVENPEPETRDAIARLEEKLFAHLLSADANPRCLSYFINKNPIEIMVKLGLESESKEVAMRVVKVLDYKLKNEDPNPWKYTIKENLQAMAGRSKIKEVRLLAMKLLADSNLNSVTHHADDVQEYLAIIGENHEAIVKGRKGELILGNGFRLDALDALIRNCPDKKIEAARLFLEINFGDNPWAFVKMLETSRDGTAPLISREELKTILDTVDTKVLAKIDRRKDLPYPTEEKYQLLNGPILERLGRVVEEFSKEPTIGALVANSSEVIAYARCGFDQKILSELVAALEKTIASITFDIPDMHLPFVVLRELANRRDPSYPIDKVEFLELRGKVITVLDGNLKYCEAAINQLKATMHDKWSPFYYAHDREHHTLYRKEDGQTIDLAIDLRPLLKSAKLDTQLLAVELMKDNWYMVWKDAPNLVKNSLHAEVRRKALEAIETFSRDERNYNYERIEHKARMMLDIIKDGKYEDVIPQAIRATATYSSRSIHSYPHFTDMFHYERVTGNPTLLAVAVNKLRTTKMFTNRDALSLAMLAAHTINEIERTDIVAKLLEQRGSEELMKGISTTGHENMVAVFRAVIQQGERQFVQKIRNGAVGVNSELIVAATEALNSIELSPAEQAKELIGRLFGTA